MEFGKKVSACIAYQGVRYKKVAEDINLSPQNVATMKRSTYFSFEILKKVAESTGTELLCQVQLPNGKVIKAEKSFNQMLRDTFKSEKISQVEIAKRLNRTTQQVSAVLRRQKTFSADEISRWVSFAGGSFEFYFLIPDGTKI